MTTPYRPHSGVTGTDTTLVASGRRRRAGAGMKPGAIGLYEEALNMSGCHADAADGARPRAAAPGRPLVRAARPGRRGAAAPMPGRPCSTSAAAPGG